MIGPDSYELSAAYMNGLVSAVREAGLLDGALATLTDAQRSAYLLPARQPWWDARFAEDLAAAVYQVFGERALDQVGYDVVAEAIGPLVLPQIQQILASGAGPEALFAQLDGFARAAVRPIQTRWTQTGPGQGTLELIYPRALRPETGILWRGAIRYAFELAHRLWQIRREAQDPPGHLISELSWS